MSFREMQCPRCGSTSLVRLDRTNPQLIADLVRDGEKVHVPVFYIHQCENGHRFEMDVTRYESNATA